MVDEACGIDGARDRVTLCCPDCDKAIRVMRDETDHPRAAFVSFPCRDCRGDTEPDVEYFDAAMNPLDPDEP